MYQPTLTNSFNNFRNFQLPQSSASAVHLQQIPTHSSQHNFERSAVVHIVPSGHQTTALASSLNQPIPATQLHLISLRTDQHPCQAGSNAFSATFLPANLIQSGHNHSNVSNSHAFLVF